MDSSRYQDGDYQKLEEYMKGKSLSKPDQLLERKIKNSYTSSYTDCEVLLLSDGSAMVIEANEGCGGCSSGNFMVDFTVEYPHAITKLSYNDYSDDDGSDVEEIIAHSQKDKKGTPIIRVSGTVGNGYYGEGYELTLVPAKDVKELNEKTA